MSADLTSEVTRRLTGDDFGWLTTVAKAGGPVPRLIWFLYSENAGGAELSVYTLPDAAKVSHIRRHPQVSVNLDSDGAGGGIIVIGGNARIDAENVDPRTDEPYWAKYGSLAEKIGIAEDMASYSTRITISIEKVWTTPTP